MTTYNELLKQIEALTKQAEDLRKNEVAGVIADIKAKMQEYSITLADLGGGPARSKKAASSGKVAVKYRNVATGETWSGRGRTPKWLSDAEAGGAKKEDFLVG
jgi:DNA-binding protein H-NS